MKLDPARRHRRSIRLQVHDYAAPGAYAVTFCTHQRECWLASVEGTGAVATEMGAVVEDHLRSLRRWFPLAHVDTFVVMPNHVHAIIVIRAGQTQPSNDVRAQELRGSRPRSIPAIVQNVKSVFARRIHALRGTPGAPVWQRDYYERVLRENEVEHARAYIAANPARWNKDAHNPLSDDIETDRQV